MISNSKTTVVDVGARYGKHPSWSGFGGDLLYFAFEPDSEEAERLRQKNNQVGFEVVESALAREEGERDFYITKHRGYCSFYKPDPESRWFKRDRPGEGQIESVIRVQTSSLDSFANSRAIAIDFLKIDSEGSELEILQGSEQQISTNVLGIRCEVHFQLCYKNQPLFSEVFNYLIDKNFFLLNIDYFGRGVPSNSLFRNPNPLVPDNQRYGTLIGTDMVLLKNYDWVCKHFTSGESSQLAYTTLKYAYFCLLNNAPDVALETLRIFIKENKGKFAEVVKESRLYQSLRRTCIEYLGQYRVNPETQEWELARSLSQDIFEVEIEAGNKYWELIQRL